MKTVNTYLFTMHNFSRIGVQPPIIQSTRIGIYFGISRQASSSHSSRRAQSPRASLPERFRHGPPRR